MPADRRTSEGPFTRRMVAVGVPVNDRFQIIAEHDA